jgi:hypothetical protein
MIKKITNIDQSYHYQDTDDNKFSRVLAGFAWPTSKPGFVVVAGEDYYASDEQSNVRYLRVLVEFETSDLERLFRRCLDLRERFQVERIIGDMDNEPMMELLYNFNRSLDGGRRLTISDCAFCDDLAYHIQLIKAVTRFNDKSLHIGSCNALRGHLSSITLEDASLGSARDYPAVMALGYLTAYVKNHPRDPVRDRLRAVSKEEDYNPLTYGLGLKEF